VFGKQKEVKLFYSETIASVNEEALTFNPAFSPK